MHTTSQPTFSMADVAPHTTGTVTAVTSSVHNCDGFLEQVLDAFPALRVVEPEVVPLKDITGRRYGEAVIYSTKTQTTVICPVRVVRLRLHFPNTGETHDRLLCIWDEHDATPHLWLHWTSITAAPTNSVGQQTTAPIMVSFHADLVPRVPCPEAQPSVATYGHCMFSELEAIRDRIYTVRGLIVQPTVSERMPHSPYAASGFLPVTAKRNGVGGVGADRAVGGVGAGAGADSAVGAVGAGGVGDGDGGNNRNPEVDTVFSCLQQYLQHWLALTCHDSDLGSGWVHTDSTADQLMRQDRVLAKLFCHPQNDPLAAMVEWACGGDAMRPIRVGLDLERPQNAHGNGDNGDDGSLSDLNIGALAADYARRLSLEGVAEVSSLMTSAQDAAQGAVAAAQPVLGNVAAAVSDTVDDVSAYMNNLNSLGVVATGVSAASVTASQSTAAAGGDGGDDDGSDRSLGQKIGRLGQMIQTHLQKDKDKDHNAAAGGGGGGGRGIASSEPSTSFVSLSTLEGPLSSPTATYTQPVGPLQGGSRSVRVSIDNRTGVELRRLGMTVKVGIFSMHPSSIVAPGGMAEMVSESDSMMRGTQGSVTYRAVGGGSGGSGGGSCSSGGRVVEDAELTFAWDNPFAGRCEYESSVVYKGLTVGKQPTRSSTSSTGSVDTDTGRVVVDDLTRPPYIIERDYLTGQGKHVAVTFVVTQMPMYGQIGRGGGSRSRSGSDVGGITGNAARGASTGDHGLNPSPSYNLGTSVDDNAFRVAMAQTCLENPLLGYHLPAPGERAAAISAWALRQRPPIDVLLLQGVHTESARTIITHAFKPWWKLSEIGRRDLFLDSGFLVASRFPVLHSQFSPFPPTLVAAGGAHRGALVVTLDASSRVTGSRVQIVLTNITRDSLHSWDALDAIVKSSVLPDTDSKLPPHVSSHRDLGVILCGTFESFPTLSQPVTSKPPSWIARDTFATSPHAHDAPSCVANPNRGGDSDDAALAIRSGVDRAVATPVPPSSSSFLSGSGGVGGNVIETETNVYSFDPSLNAMARSILPSAHDVHTPSLSSSSGGATTKTHGSMSSTATPSASRGSRHDRICVVDYLNDPDGDGTPTRLLLLECVENGCIPMGSAVHTQPSPHFAVVATLKPRR